jgi:hypothetical protein
MMDLTEFLTLLLMNDISAGDKLLIMREMVASSVEGRSSGSRRWGASEWKRAAHSSSSVLLSFDADGGGGGGVESVEESSLLLLLLLERSLFRLLELGFAAVRLLGDVIDGVTAGAVVDAEAFTSCDDVDDAVAVDLFAFL